MAVSQTIVRYIRVGVPIKKIQPADRLEDLADVRIRNLQDGDFLIYDSDLSQWVNKQVLPENLFFQVIDGGSF